VRLLRTAIAVLALLAVVPAAADARRKPPPTPKPQPSPFAWRGVVEGYYGTPWTHGDRTRLLRWMGTHGFNAYVHAPKGDAYQTIGWRDPYPAAVQRNFDREIAMARRLGVRWIPSVSPARGDASDPKRLCFSCAGDVDAMLAKLQPFLTAGATTVMVSFDDIRRELGPTDAAVYGARFPGAPVDYLFGRATAEYLNALLARLPARTGLLTVLSDYSGTTDTPYLQGFRDGQLNPAVGVMWTGPTIRAADFTAAEAASYSTLIGRTPIVWENWVARDFVPTRIFLGPFSKHNAVDGAVQGFFFNPANEPDLNLLPLATAGAWMQDPAHYDSRAAWTAAVAELTHASEPLEDQFRAWAETNYSSGLLTEEAPTSRHLQETFLAMFSRGARWVDAAAALRAELDLVVQAPRGVQSLPNRRIAAQAAPFLAAARRAARAGRRGVDLLAAERPSLRLRRAAGGYTGVARPPDPSAAAGLRAQLASDWARVRAAPIYVYGCRVRTRGCGARQYNRMDDFLTKVTALDAAWLPTAELAGSRVRVTLGATRIRVAADGTFTLPPATCGARVLATDAAGGATSLPLPPCPRKRRGHG
jgi:hyaluronoglucosaminidase